MQFSQPAAGSDFRAKDHVGHLLLIYVRELREGIVTQYGTSDAISADVVVLTDPSGTPRCEPQVLFFQKPLIGSLRNSIGKDPVLARLGQGTAKPGQSAPYILNPFNEQDAAYATQWLTSVGGNPFQAAPTVSQPAPAAVPQAAPVAPLPQAVPAAPAVASMPMPQAPGVPQAPPQWAAPAAAPAPSGQGLNFAALNQAPAAPVGAGSPEAAAAAHVLGMQVPPPAPGQ